MVLNQPLDLVKVFIVDLAGTPEIFSFVAMILFAFIAAKFNFPNKITLALFALFTVIMSAYLSGLFIIVNIIIGLVVYYNLSKMGK